MIVRDLLQSTNFDAVKKELLLSRPFSTDKLNQFLSYYNEISQGKIEHNDYILTTNRENFEYGSLFDPLSHSFIDDVFTHIPVEIYLGADVNKDDVRELSPALIIAGLLVALTFEGTCFTEQDREEKIIYMKRKVKLG